jgi:DNA-binding transcriptional regulator YiaG
MISTQRLDRWITSEFRERHGLSQSQLAALLDVSVRTLQDWEQGRGAPAVYLKRALNDVARELKTPTKKKARSK